MVKLYESPFDVGSATEEQQEPAANMTMRADLMIMIRDHIKQQNWTQSEAAKLLGVTQPRISNLQNGKIDLFALDALVGMLNKLGISVKVTPVAAKPNSKTASGEHREVC